MIRVALPQHLQTLARVGADMKPVWKVELPLSETAFVRRVAHWTFDDHLVAVGMMQTEAAGVTSRKDQLVSVDLRHGQLSSLDLTGDPKR